MYRQCFKLVFLFWVFITNTNTFVWGQEISNDTIAIRHDKDAHDLVRDLIGKDPFTPKEQSHRDSSKVYFSVLPSFASAGSEKGFVTSFMSAFYLGNPKTTNLSTVYFTPYFTFSEQYVIPMRTYIWTNNNSFNLMGDYRFMKYPQVQFDIYDPNNQVEQCRINYYQTRFYQTISKSVLPNLAVGLGVQYDYYTNIVADQVFIDKPTAYQKYGDTAQIDYYSLGPTIEVIFDNRRNTINPLNGSYGRISYRHNLAGSGNFQDWSSITIDARKYFPINQKKERILAVWMLYWSVLNNKPNYLDLPSNGWDNYGRSGRGLYRNRYRSSGILYFETEYRSPITINGLWSMVAFANFTSPAILFTQQFHLPKMAAGLGIRLKFDKRTGGKLGADIAVSGDYWTYYLSLNEYF
jgi:hypothetical protein